MVRVMSTNFPGIGFVRLGIIIFNGLIKYFFWSIGHFGILSGSFGNFYFNATLWTAERAGMIVIVCACVSVCVCVLVCDV